VVEIGAVKEADFTCRLMFVAFSYSDKGEFLIDSKAWSDFAANLP
jgi:hypothetical protein